MPVNTIKKDLNPKRNQRGRVGVPVRLRVDSMIVFRTTIQADLTRHVYRARLTAACNKAPLNSAA